MCGVVTLPFSAVALKASATAAAGAPVKQNGPDPALAELPAKLPAISAALPKESNSCRLLLPPWSAMTSHCDACDVRQRITRFPLVPPSSQFV